ncbi:hypothetical protein LSTR_LSTR000500 [Laodelphax striatellus]|uniref:Ribosomal protein eL8/eL30/eS12/Gadd45 domain-containing protein n=1 Tax=Laodelphax striatellus TaxID=195883 RepID=A0A482X2H0_LAOST|nr:hypothetical protein LSTR_LSTR000500 [Laodelphax striatellus]
MTKKKQSNIIKNVLADPYDSFWPHVNGKDEEALNDHINRFLSMAKLHRGFISNKNLRVIHREKSKARRKELWKTMVVPPGVSEDEIAKNKENRKALVLGVNSVARGIEHSKVACCVVCGESSGRPLVQHIVLSAAQRKVPVIVLNNLRQTTNQCLGHSCAVFALKKEISENKEHVFHPLYEAIKSLAQTFPIPEHVMRSSSDNDSDGEGIVKDKKTKNSEIVKSQPTCKFAYLTRPPGSKSRVFVPETIIQKRSTIGFGDYAALPTDVDDRLNVKMEYSDDSSNEMDDDDDNEDDVNTIADHNQLPEGKDLFFIDKVSRPQITSRKRKMKLPPKLKPLAVKRMKGNPKKIKRNKKGV